MAALPLALALQIATASVDTVAPETLLSFAQHESGLEPNVVHDNTTGRTFYPPTAAAAAKLANELLAAGHNFDSGILQVNSRNLERTGLTTATAFKPAENMRAGAQILVEAYQRCQHGGTTEPQAALRCAASVYNTGREQAGIRNGYQARVWRVAARIVPAIEVAQAASDPEPIVRVPMPPPPVPPAAVEDLLHAGPPVPLSSANLEDALPHHGENK